MKIINKFIKITAVTACFFNNMSFANSEKTLSKEEISGLEKTAMLYIKLNKKYWNDIKISEKNNKEGLEMFDKLNKMLNKEEEEIGEDGEESYESTVENLMEINKDYHNEDKNNQAEGE